MIFFILALALVLLGYSGIEKKNLCVTRAQGLANAIRSSIANVLTAPVEDEQKVIPLERVLSIGESDYVKYGIKITNLVGKSDQPNSLVIEVLPTGAKDCNGGGNVAYPQDTKLKFVSQTTTDSRGNEVLEVDPYGTSTEERSWYIIIIKCMKKTWPTEQYIYIEDCKHGKLDQCQLNSLSTSYVAGCCGWATPTPQATCP